MYKLKQTKTNGKTQYWAEKDQARVEVNSLTTVEVIKLCLGSRIYSKSALNELILPTQKINCYTDLQTAYAFYQSVPQKYKAKTLKIISLLDDRHLLQHATDFAESGKISVEDFLKMVVQTEQRKLQEKLIHQQTQPTQPTNPNNGRTLPKKHNALNDGNTK